MPDVDNHMDELFQKAAENYPLKTNTGNFDDLMPFIGNVANAATKPVLLKGKRKTALLLLAFLTTAMSIGTYLITNTHKNNTATNLTISTVNTGASTQNNTNAQVNKNFDENIIGNVARENMVSTNETIFQKNKSGYNNRGSIYTTITQPNAVTDEDATKKNEGAVTEAVTVNKPDAETVRQQEEENIKQDATAKKENIVKLENKNESQKEVAKASSKKNKTKPVFYYGIAAGIELNKVKTQDMTKTGFNGGVILGLQINKKIAVETGLQLSQKKYYSDGKYFKPKSGSMPANMTVTSLQSTSTLIEIPVSVKYNFSKKRNTLYGKAGISSYIITKESNKYNAVVSGQQQEVNSTYKANKDYLASDIRISAGYQHSASKKINMRIEPYIQIPLKGIGIGALPVTTAGLQIVLTRN